MNYIVMYRLGHNPGTWTIKPCSSYSEAVTWQDMHNISRDVLESKIKRRATR